MALTEYPDGRPFSFTILDNAENARVETVRPFYRFLRELGIGATKLVWSRSTGDIAARGSCCALDDPEYLDFVLELRDLGFEIGWAGPSDGSNTREQTIEGLERFREAIGYYPRVFANGSNNRGSIYWGTNRIDQPLLKAVVQRAAPMPPGFFLGHVAGSSFWWGDICLERVNYVLNLTFDEVDIGRINPTLPYHDPSRPYVRWWFSGAAAENCGEFNQLLRPDRQDRLQREAGCCIATTRISRGFVRNDQVDRLARKRLESLVERGGWFVTVSDMLDFLRTQNGERSISTDEWDRMQWKWSRDIVRRRARLSTHKEKDWIDTAIGQ